MFYRIIKNKNKPSRYTFLLAASVFLLIAGAGYIKFNFFDDDIYISGDSLTEEDLAGSWVEPIPGLDNDSADTGGGENRTLDKVQGFTLYEDGSAESINMQTLLVLKWRIENGYLILTEKSIGNGTSSTGEERYKIDAAGKKKLVLRKGNALLEYKRFTK